VKIWGTKSMNEGKKFDKGKMRTDLIPPEALRHLAQVLDYGAEKYGDRNWENGINYSRLYGATLRHLLAWWEGEDIDPESRFPHLSHALTNLAFLVHHYEQRPEFDDRPSRSQVNKPPIVNNWHYRVPETSGGVGWFPQKIGCRINEE